MNLMTEAPSKQFSNDVGVTQQGSHVQGSLFTLQRSGASAC